MRHQAWEDRRSPEGERVAVAYTAVPPGARPRPDVARPAAASRRQVSAAALRPHAAAVRYLRIYLVSLLGLAAALIGVNALVDPFDIFGTRIPGINAVKDDAYNHMRLYKAVAVERVRPAAIVLGTSRSHFGLDPAHPGWSGGQGYNLSLFDGRIYEMRRYLQHAQATRPLQQVVLALDFFSFNGREKTKGDFDEGRLADDRWPWIVRRLPDLVDGLVSLDALRSSLHTLRGQDDPCVPRATAAGMHDDAAFICQARSVGQRQMFRDSEATFLAKHYDRYLLAYPDGTGSPLEDLRELVAFARDADIDLRLLISPAHARQYEAIDLSGLWPAWEQWKRETVAILAADAAAHPGEQPFPLWDFSGYNSVTTEPVPDEGDAESRMRWYWDSSHYRRETGDLVLDRVLRHREVERELPPDFGVLLTRGNLERHLRDIRDAQAAYRRARPGELQEIAELSTAEQR